jgi:uncharacterized protein
VENIKKISIVAMIAMAVISFTNLFGISVAGISVFLGVAFFFVNKAMEKQPFAGSGLDFKAIGTGLKEKSIWFWIAMPIIMDVVSITLSKLFLPEYIDHVLARAGNLVSFNAGIFLILQLIVLALGEEIAWRAFFQKQLQKALPIAPVLIISSILFALGHIASGNFTIVAYDVFFVFVNSILYGVIFHKTNNAWISTISHFAANLFSVIVLVFL